MEIKKIPVISAIMIFGVLSACQDSQQPTESTSKAVVSVGQATHAFNVVKGIDYLPFTYADDGCYARSLYMGLELAAQEIPSSAVWLHGNLEPFTNRRVVNSFGQPLTWRYHVAPLIINKQTNSIYVLDPSLDNNPLLLDQWVDKADGLGSDNERYQYVITDNTRINDLGFSKHGASLNNISKEIFARKSLMPYSIDEMSMFNSKIIQAACEKMHQYIGRENLDAGMQAAKRSKLIQATRRLVTNLQRKNLLDQTPGSTNGVCGVAFAQSR